MESKKIKILRDALGSYYRSSSELLFCCPKCKHVKKKLSVNIEKNVFKCWICEYSGKDIGSLLKYYGSRESSSQWREITGRVEITTFDELFSEGKEKIPEKKEVLELPKSYKFLGADINSNSLPAAIYLRDRGVDIEDVYKWRIGYCESGVHSGRVIIPSFDVDGDLNYYIARSFGDQWPKYMNPRGNKDLVFNELSLDWSEDIVIVEGVFDAIKAQNAIPLLGSSLREDSDIFKKILQNKKEVYLALDPDVKSKTIKMAKKFLQYGLSVSIVDFDNYEDVGCMSKNQFNNFKTESSFIEDEYYLLYESLGL